MRDKNWDVFISHASEDESSVAAPLAKILAKAGVKVWLDAEQLRVGDSLTSKIDEGLARSHFGIVILSPAFFAKHWPGRELAGLRAREEEGRKVILPVWHNVDKSAVASYSPILADAIAVSTERGIDKVANALLEAVFHPSSETPSAQHPDVARRLITLCSPRARSRPFSARWLTRRWRAAPPWLECQQFFAVPIKGSGFPTAGAH